MTYFSLRSILLFALAALVLLNIYKLAVNFLGGNCKLSPASTDRYPTDSSLNPCSSDWSTIHTVANYNLRKEDLIERAILLAYFFVHSLFLAFLKKFIELKHKQVDDSTLDPTDYSVTV